MLNIETTIGTNHQVGRNEMESAPGLEVECWKIGMGKDGSGVAVGSGS